MSCSRTLIRIFLSVWLLVISQLSSAQEINLPVQILGHAYEAIITENTHLQRKVSDSTLLDESKHYSGVIKNIELVLGRKLRCSIQPDEAITLDMLMD